MTKHVIVIPRAFPQEDDAERMRAALAEKCLWQMVQAARSQVDPLVLRNIGLHEAEAFLEAIRSGGRHPLLTLWEERKKCNNRPTPGMPTVAMRRQIILAVAALNAVGLGDAAARRMVAGELQRQAGLPSPTPEAIRNWTRSQSAVTAEEQSRVDEVVARFGPDHKRLMHHFFGLAHFAGNPAAVALMWC